LKGKFINNTLKGQWENKGMEGLVEFIVTGNKLEGNWKKGLKLGAMKKKWEGKLNAEVDTKQNSTNGTAMPITAPTQKAGFRVLKIVLWLIKH